MSTPQLEVQQKPRKVMKKGNAQNMRAAISENEASDYPSQSQPPGGGGKGRQRRRSTAKKQNTNYDSAAYSDGPNVRQNPHPVKHHATPVKSQAYAGPTFHQSPAASALPLPSFYSKSLPSHGMMKPVLEDDRPATQIGEVRVSVSPPAETKRESTPLDFLFDAARKAHVTPGSESPQHKLMSPVTAKSPSGSPAPREGDTVFPFEMDTNEPKLAASHQNSSTPFKDRLEAIRPGSAATTAGKQLDEEERRVKTAALKNFLLNSAKATELADNPFNARPAPQYQPPPPLYQRRSNPSTPMQNAYGDSPNQNYFPQYLHGPGGPGSPTQRQPGSNLRNIYAPESTPNTMSLPTSRDQEPNHISTAPEQTPVKRPYKGYYTPPTNASPERRTTPSAQQLEDDLRRVLKLDLTSRG